MNIALIGYGKMGKAIERTAKERGHTISLTINKDNQQDLRKENLKDIDVAIEFSTPDAAVFNYFFCFENEVPVVSGTTGWLAERSKVEKVCMEGGSFFYASNFSLGVNLFFAINTYVAKLLQPYENYKPEIEETHHAEKLDAPSGTAITIAEGILQNNPKFQKWQNAVTNTEDVLPILSKRLDDVPGTHTVSYSSDEDVIRLQHDAKGREGFALGAVLAAEFLVKQEGGWYGMNDLLKF